MDKPRFLTKRGFFLCMMACRRESKKAQVQKAWVKAVRVQKAPGGRPPVLFWAVPPVWSCVGPCGVLWREFCVKHMVYAKMVYAKRTGTGSDIMTSVLCSGPVGRAVGRVRDLHGLCQTYRHGFGHHDKYVVFWPCGPCSGSCPGPVGVTGPRVVLCSVHSGGWACVFCCGPLCMMSQARGMRPMVGGFCVWCCIGPVFWRPL